MSEWLASMPAGVDLAALALAALVAGVINAIAGGGSLLMIPMLIAVGLPPTVANGTLRIAILVQAVLATITFQRQGVREIPASLRLMLPVIGGAALGTWFATRLPDTSMHTVFGVLLAVWAVVLVFRPERFLREQSEPRTPTALVYGAAVVVGIYGGFLQAGVGFPLLALVVLGLGRSMVDGNAIKSVLVAAYSAVSLALFVAAGDVAWREGAGLAVGSAVGGWAGARWQIRGGVRLVRWVLIAAVAVSAAAILL